MLLRLHNVELALPETRGEQLPQALSAAAARRLGVGRGSIGRCQVVRRSLDVRRQRARYNFSLDVHVDPILGTRLVNKRRAELPPTLTPERWHCRVRPQGPPPVVVGAGPAGLLAALTLARGGYPPILFDRGEPVQTRARSVSRLYSRGILNPESNVCFGEGGAGTFSDGKLYTRVGDARVDNVMQTLVAMGAPPDILIDNRPHLGTDRLVALLVRIRAELTALGCDIRYGTRVDDLVIHDNAVTGVRLSDGSVQDAAQVVLATGHSARDIWDKLLAARVPLEARPFAVGFRVEHPQALIDSVRYGAALEEGLPAADYRLVYNQGTQGVDHRAVYSFCMCPGGVVVATPTQAEALCINGMSHASRKGRFANSALVVSVTPADFAAAGFTGVFAGVDFQEAVERRAYEAGGGAFVAPACRVTDFGAAHQASPLGSTSYRRGLCPSPLHTLYPTSITDALTRALDKFDHTLRGFKSAEGTLIGVETRTASPIRVPRNAAMQAVGVANLYPAGEGMGYGGGIVSAAVDGLRAAEAVLQSVGAIRDVMPAT